MRSILILLAMACLWGSPESRADDTARDAEIQAELAAHERDPGRAFQVPPKWIDGARVDEGESAFFGSGLIQGGQFVSLKRRARRAMVAEGLREGFDYEAQGFEEDLVYQKLSDISASGFEFAALPVSPWSGDYWPLYLGMTARRFADPKFPNSKDWKINSDYVLGQGNSSSIDRLSAAEKYDLLVGDTNKSLTRYALQSGKTYYDRYGKVASWMGICHGWAPAAYREDRPARRVRLMAVDGRTWVTFHPDDIKALASMLWANTSYAVDWSGARCTKSNPARDSNGRIIDPACRDQDPGQWHLILVNRLGALKKPFVIDATYDYQVWNQPLRSYRYTYFNPSTLKSVRTLAEGTVAVAEFANDKFRQYRSSRTVSVVGIALDLTYIFETKPSSAATDSPSADKAKTVRYLYDLELDREGKVVKGEWRSVAHPDFLWSPKERARAWSKGDQRLDSIDPSSSWAGDVPMPATWAREAVASSRSGQPLARIIATLQSISRFEF